MWGDRHFHPFSKWKVDSMSPAGSLNVSSSLMFRTTSHFCVQRTSSGRRVRRPLNPLPKALCDLSGRAPRSGGWVTSDSDRPTRKPPKNHRMPKSPKMKGPISGPYHKTTCVFVSSRNHPTSFWCEIGPVFGSKKGLPGPQDVTTAGLLSSLPCQRVVLCEAAPPLQALRTGAGRMLDDRERRWQDQHPKLWGCSWPFLGLWVRKHRKRWFGCCTFVASPS